MTKDSTLSFFNRTDQAQRRSERHCQRSLSSRGASLQQLLWRSQRLHQKGGVIASEIMLPPHAPEIYLDRATLWNAVENCEKHPKAQLAYSFDIAMQNELTLEENMELARKFVQEQFVTKGMIADLAFHSPEKEDGGIPNPHFHVMTTMRPLNPDGTWGQNSVGNIFLMKMETESGIKTAIICLTLSIQQTGMSRKRWNTGGSSGRLPLIQNLRKRAGCAYRPPFLCAAGA